ncbi:MAG TPA: VCBS domain-containing protein, partial [Mycobacteriales bacterium]|nr:VCBS domain-containing protein [Mycobacteriales bacterium]
TIGNFVAGDTLTWTNAGSVTGAYNAATGVLTLSGTDTLANYQAVMRSVKFSSSSDDPTADNTRTTRTVTWAATDANSDAVGAKTSAGVTSTINVTAVNDASTLATGSTLNYTENGAAAPINAALTVADLDNPTLPSATVSITGNFAAGQDVLSFTNVPATMGNIAGAYNAATGVMTLSSAGSTATLAQWQVALRAVQYSNSSDNPSTSARTVSYTVNDGTANSNTVTSTVNVAAVNDAAVLGSATVALAETNAPLTTGGTLTITDVDSPQTFVPQTNVAGTNGTFSIAANGAWTYTANSAFDNLNVGQSVSDTFTVASADGTTTTVQVTINGTNDAAVLSSATVALSETNAP